MSTSPPPSPAPKRHRGSYTSKACIQCRRRKLKCSGHRPCQRCSTCNYVCYYTENRRATEAPHSPNTSVQREPRYFLSGQAQTAAPELNGPPAIEERMERMEALMESLISSKNAESFRASVEPEHAGTELDDFQGWDTTFNAPISIFNANLAPVRRQLGIRDQAAVRVSSPWVTDKIGAVTATSPVGSADHSSSQICVGPRKLPFPSSAQYEKYIQFFFDDINACHSCVNEADFRIKSEKLLNSNPVGGSDVCFLALNYIIFACCDVLVDVSPPGSMAELPGWQWFRIADELVAKRKISGRGDMSLIQFLIFESLYLTHADKPNEAYNVIGIACRLCFQFGLHQQSFWGSECSSYSAHMRQRVFWTVYFTDRRISLSCGRPYGMRDLDIKVEHPAWLYDKDLQPGQDLPDPNHNQSCNMYLTCMIAFAKLAGEVWDQVFSAGASSNSCAEETIAVLDARIRHWSETVLPVMPLLPANGPPTRRHLRQESLVKTRICHLRLLLRRSMMVSLSYHAATGRLCGQLAMEVVQEIQKYRSDITEPSSFRFHMATSLGSAILILATLLSRQLSVIGLQDQQPAYAESFRGAVVILHDLAIYLQAARRMANDLKDIIDLITKLLNQSSIAMQEDIMNTMPDNIDDLFPYDAVDFAQQKRPHMELTGNGGGGDVNSGSLGYDALDWSNGWDFDFQQSATGYGAPWI